MNEMPKTELPAPRGFFRRCFSWRSLRRAIISLLGLATLIGLVVTEENWRGKHDWETYRHEQEAKGEQFDWQAFAPPSVPDDQNFLAAPIFTNMLGGRLLLSPYRSGGSSPTNAGGNWQKQRLTELKPWQTFYRNPPDANAAKEFPIAPQPQSPAADVLFALSKFDQQIADLRQASLRPYAFVPVHYEDGINMVATSLLPYLAVTKRCAQVLELRSVAELADGQSTNALNDIELLLRVSDALHHPPLLISQLVHMAIVNIVLQPVWEGLAEHRWSDQQLIALDAALAREDFLADYEMAMRGERTCAISTYEIMRHTSEMFEPDKDGNTVTVKMTWMPNAFFYQNELAFAQLYQQWLFPLVDTNTRTISPVVWRQVDAAAQDARKHFSLYSTLARMTVPALDPGVKKIAFSQSSIDLARVACALERYRLAHGQYPDSLAALEPQFITQVPHDIINGQPLHYRLRPDGLFILYSVGWNETDDGGTVVIDQKYGTVKWQEGDWVWQYPEK
jgi:hypothetical protein